MIPPDDVRDAFVWANESRLPPLMSDRDARWRREPLQLAWAQERELRRHAKWDFIVVLAGLFAVAMICGALLVGAQGGS